MCVYREVFFFLQNKHRTVIRLTSEIRYRDDSRFAPSQWETLQNNAVSHWLGANLESTLRYTHTSQLMGHRSNYIRTEPWQVVLQTVYGLRSDIETQADIRLISKRLAGLWSSVPDTKLSCFSGIPPLKGIPLLKGIPPLKAVGRPPEYIPWNMYMVRTLLCLAMMNGHSQTSMVEMFEFGNGEIPYFTEYGITYPWNMPHSTHEPFRSSEPRASANLLENGARPLAHSIENEMAINNTNQIQWGAVITQSIFSQIVTIDTRGSPMGARYGMSFVCLNS